MQIWPFEHYRSMTTGMGWAVAVLLISLLAIGPAAAEAPPPDDKPAVPIHISADRLVSDSGSNNAEFSGHVKVVQDQTTIVADRLTLIYKDGNMEQTGMNASSIKSIEAQGHVHIELDNRVAVGEKAVYTTSDRKLVLTGPGAKVINGPNVVEGDTITFYRDTGRVEMVGQVKATIQSDQRGLN